MYTSAAKVANSSTDFRPFGRSCRKIEKEEPECLYNHQHPASVVVGPWSSEGSTTGRKFVEEEHTELKAFP